MYCWWGATYETRDAGALVGHETVREAIKRSPEMAEVFRDLAGVGA
jgi:hypothetical protein